jgi:hypothetical protein
MAETLALVLGNTKIWAAGTFWERRKFPNRTLFAPYAYKEQLNTRKFKLEDLARLNSTGIMIKLLFLKRVKHLLRLNLTS